MSDLSNNIAVCVFTFFDNKMRYNLLNTTDVKSLKNELHYSGDRDDELFVGRKVRLKSEIGKEKNYEIVSINIHYFKNRLINRELVGDQHPYNVQVMVWVDAAE